MYLSSSLVLTQLLFVLPTHLPHYRARRHDLLDLRARAFEAEWPALRAALAAAEAGVAARVMAAVEGAGGAERGLALLRHFQTVVHR
jgi:hypothetical protein